ncbi:GNAT family N-acetyltransferase [Amaricoccus tamworthensis]|uniref:GNAT family N-acetyltransferase n=1 Tax=Amaricoccus tamworthensis TaxID=57002 RepID=UPI003C798424
MPEITLRLFTDPDAAATADLFYRAIHEGTRDHYTTEQRRAWAPQRPETTCWRERLNSQYAVIAETGPDLAGFMTLDENGYIDLAFVDPAHTGQGIGSALLNAITTEASRRGMHRLKTHASLAARPFFERHGWTIVKQQTITRGGAGLANYVMEVTVP